MQDGWTVIQKRGRCKTPSGFSFRASRMGCKAMGKQRMKKKARKPGCTLCGCNEDDDIAKRYYHMASHVIFEDNPVQGGCSTA